MEATKVAAHTPGLTPQRPCVEWSVCTVTTATGRNKISLYRAQRRVCDISIFDDADRQTVQHIVRACNAHDGLVAAVVALLDADALRASDALDLEEVTMLKDNARATARAALAKARP